METLGIISLVVSGMTGIAMVLAKKDHLRSKCCGCDVEIDQQQMNDIKKVLEETLHQVQTDPKQINPVLLKTLKNQKK